MQFPCKWTFVAIVLYLSCNGKALCQNKYGMVKENRECTKLPGTPSSSDMLNSILNTAACNGVLPDLTSMLHGQPIVENLSRCPYSQEILTKPLSVVPMTGINSQEPIIFSSQPIRPPINQNVLVATPLPCGSGCPSNIIPAIPQTISPQPVPSSNCISQIAQALPLENYSVCATNAGVVQPTNIVLQPQSQCNEVNPYFYNQVTEPISLAEVMTNPLNLPTSPPQILPSINTCSGMLELNPNLGSPCLSQPIVFTPCLSQPIVFTNDVQQTPFQTNLPAASVPVPVVTVVSSSPSKFPVPFPSGPEFPSGSANLPSFQYPPQPPILLGGCSKSSWKKYLPLILMALFSDRGCNDGGGCCRCCSCDRGSGSSIPIPYPIPIPINNPVINTGSCCCCDRESICSYNRDDDYD